MLSVNDFGGTTSGQGVSNGKYYFEATVSGACAIVGLATDSSAGSMFPGFDEESIGFGEIYGESYRLQGAYRRLGKPGSRYDSEEETVVIHGEHCPASLVRIVNSSHCVSGEPHFDPEGAVCAHTGTAEEAYCSYVAGESACARCDLPRVGVAVDTETGHVWFSLEGKWLNYEQVSNPNYPTTSLTPGNAAGKLPTGYEFIYAAVGRTAKKDPPSPQVCPGPATVKMFFKASEFKHTLPADFSAYEVTDCTCTKNFVECLEESSCTDPQALRLVFDQCSQGGCTPAECGLAPRIPAPWLCDSEVPVECNIHYLHCSSLAKSSHAECECTREMFECMEFSGCRLEAEDKEAYSQICALHGCTAEQCGNCEVSCNATQLRCMDELMYV